MTQVPRVTNHRPSRRRPEPYDAANIWFTSRRNKTSSGNCIGRSGNATPGNGTGADCDAFRVGGGGRVITQICILAHRTPQPKMISLIEKSRECDISNGDTLEVN